MELESILLPGIEAKRPIVIAGPCSAETEEQVMDTARQLAAKGQKIFRAGIWKPRTKPGGFEGIGAEGYPKANSEAGSRQGGALPCTWSKAEARAPATPQASAAGAPQAPPRPPLRPLGTGPGGGLCRRPPWQAPGPHTGNINGTGAIAACSSGRNLRKFPTGAAAPSLLPGAYAYTSGNT